jgi:hypothetical protein
MHAEIINAGDTRTDIADIHAPLNRLTNARNHRDGFTTDATSSPTPTTLYQSPNDLGSAHQALFNPDH